MAEGSSFYPAPHGAERQAPRPLAVRPAVAAEILGVGQRTLWRWTDEGLLRCVRPSGPNGAKLYIVADLERFLATLADGPAAGASDGSDEKGGARG